jgi:hypothetical protein
VTGSEHRDVSKSRIRKACYWPKVKNMIYIYIYLTAIGLTPGGSSTSHIYTHTIHIIHTYSMEQSPSWEANQFLQLVKKFPTVLWNPKVLYCIHKCPPMICNPHQTFSGDKIEKNEMGGACSTYWDRRGVCRVLVGKPDRNIPLGRPRRRWEDNMKMDYQCVGWWALTEKGKVTGLWESGNESFLSVQCGKLLDWLRNC